ncbi:MAG: IPT/TIG domain-containing protein, partial [Cytophagales bacterium]|nr:IPT/TIG domain-containing protein [Cytophagales bacterium]
MRRTLTLLLLLLPVFFAQAHPWTGAGPAGSVPLKAAGRGPSGFTENKGQVADLAGKSRPDVLYALTSGTVRVFLTKKGMIYSFIQVDDGAGGDRNFHLGGERLSPSGNPAVRTYQLEMHWAGAHAGVSVRAEEPTGETSNHYLPHCPAGVSGAKSFGKIRYENIYPRIDLVFYFRDGQLKYDFIVKPGGRVEDIRLRYAGSRGIGLAPDGSAQIANPLGSLTEGKPFTYQLRNGRMREVKARYRATGNTLGFRVDSAAYDRTRPLVIDPSLLWSTYYGDTSLDDGSTVVTAPDGSVYLAGHTQSTTGIAEPGHLNEASGGTDAFLVKFNPDGARAWATYYGGPDREEARGLAVDAAGNVYLAGTTWSKDNIAAGGHQPASGGTFDAFLVKFDAGGRRQWATFYGGEYGDAGNAVSTDAQGNVYLAGETYSPTGIAANGYQNSLGQDNIFTNKDAFLVKFNAAGVRQWGTYYGGAYVLDSDVFSNADAGYGVCTDAAGNVYLAGATRSPHGIALNGHQGVLGGYNKNYPNHQLDAFVVKFDPAGRRQWATYYGGDEYDEAHAIRADADGNVYLAGQTYSPNAIATPAAHQPVLSGSSDGFLVKFNGQGVRQWGTYFGGAGDEAAMALSLYGNGYVYLAGSTGSSTGVYYQGYSPVPAGVFLARFSTAGVRDYGTYFGGSSGQWVARNSVAVDASHNVLLSGTTRSSTDVARGGFQRRYAGGGDVFLAKFTNAPIPAPSISGLSQSSGPAGAQVLISGSHFTGVSSVQFNGVEAEFTLQSGTGLLATVPTDAQTGPLRVSTTGGTATSSQVFTVTSYCTSASRFNSDSRIEHVSFSNVNNTSNTDCSLKYADYTAAPAYVAPGQALELRVTLGSCHQTNNKTGKVFIDWNGDFDFEDADELVITSPVITYASTFGKMVTVPAGVKVGTSVRMRVVCVDTQQPELVTACGQYGYYGETEDYTLSFVPFAALPSVSGVSPAAGESGASVVLTGTGFANVQSVRFNGVAAAYTVNGPGSITATVPNGATTGRITVVTGQGTAVSPANYAVTTQSYTLRDGVQTVTTCGALSLGPNGTAGGLSSVKDGTITFTPDSPGGKIRITFLSTKMTPEDYGTLQVYDGVNTNERSVLWLYRTYYQPPPITATNAAGQLTLRFTSDHASTSANWQARIECIRPPQLTALSPGQGAIGSTVTIRGAQLTGTTAVRFNGADARFVLDDDNQVTATVPYEATTGNLTVVNAAGTATSAAAFTVIPRPVISRFTPDKGLPGSTLVVDGTHFTGATSVRINGVDVPFTLNSDTRITATVTEAAANGLVSVTTPGGTVTSYVAFAVVRPPFLISFSPAKGPVNGAVTLTGDNLQGTTSVRFNGLEASFAVVNNTKLTASVPVGATTGRITVANAAAAAESSTEFIVDGIDYCTSKATEQRGNVLAVYFGTIQDENIGCSGYREPGNRGTVVVPGQGIPLKIRTKSMCMATATTGAKLKAYVDWNVDGDFTDAGETVYASDNGMSDHSATVVVPAGIPAGKLSRLRIVLTAGMDSRQIFWPYYHYYYPLREPQSCGEYPVGQTLDYHVQLTAAAMPPRVASFSPGFGTAGTPVTLKGKNLTATSAVDFNGVPAPFSVPNDSVLVAEVPAEALSGPIRVTAGFSTAASPEGFVAQPSISGFSPRNSAVGSLISISGRNFTGTTAVRLGSREAAFVAGANNVITATVPAGFTSGRITVVNPAGTAVSADTFSVFPPPAIHHVTPVTGPAGTLVTITGENLDSPVSVHFNGVAAPRFEAKSNTTLTVTAPAGTTAGNITVVTAGGRATTSNAFTPVASPRITGFTPASGNGSSTVTVTGEHFVNVRDVRIGTYPVPYQVSSASQLVIAVPPGIGSGPVAVTTAGGTATSSGTFTFSRDPFITRFSPGRHRITTVGTSPLAVRFSEPMQADLTFPSLISVRGNQTGFHPVTPGSIAGAGTDSLAFLASAGLRPGERVQVTFAGGLRAANGLALAKPLVYEFTAASAKAAAQFTPTGTVAVGPFAVDLGVGDWDRDGDLDLVTANSNPKTISVRMNNGTGTFTGTTEITLASPLLRVLAADFDGDGDLDLVAACYNNLTLLLNDGTGAFAVQPDPVSASYYREACVADFDGDGDVDIAGYTSGTSHGWVQVWKNDGKGAFSWGESSTVGDSPESLWAGDFDNDGDVDLVASGLDNNYTDTYLLLNDGTGNFGTGKAIQAGVQTKLARGGDFDGDGDLDLALLCSVYTFGQPTLYVIFNDGRGNFTP